MTLKRIHDWFTNTVIATTIAVSIAYACEYYMTDFHDLVQYFYVTSSQDEYRPNEDIKYWSFVTSDGVEKIEWNEVTYCFIDSGWTLIDTPHYEDISWSSEQTYSPTVETILNRIYNESNFESTAEERSQLRLYAEAEPTIAGWMLNIQRPVATDIDCYSTHTVTAYTPFFNIPKVRHMQSAPFRLVDYND